MVEMEEKENQLKMLISADIVFKTALSGLQSKPPVLPTVV